jgi:DNA-directed RNA polymerase subunit RPC12/RpoP
MIFKGCIRCGGDMYDEDNIDQVDLVCLQCGFRRTLTSARSRAAAEDTAGIMRWLHSQRPSVAA